MDILDGNGKPISKWWSENHTYEKWLKNNYIEELTALILLVGLLFASFSKEKAEPLLLIKYLLLSALFIYP